MEIKNYNQITIAKILTSLVAIDKSSENLFDLWADNAKKYFPEIEEAERNAIGDMILTIRKTKTHLHSFFLSLEK